MWKRVLVVLAVLGGLAVLVGVAAVGLVAVNTLKPELANQDLRLEMEALGVTVGEATAEALTERFGPPERVRTETLADVWEYSSRGLLLRVGRTSQTLYWYEFTGVEFTTARGIRVGATYQEVVQAYGQPTTMVPLSTGPLARYRFGTAFAMEFRFDTENQLVKVVFYHS